MATTKKIDLLTFKLETKPGALAKVFASFREANVNVLATWAYQMGPTEAQGHIYASDTTKAKDVLTKIGKAPKIGRSLRNASEKGRGCRYQSGSHRRFRHWRQICDSPLRGSEGHPEALPDTGLLSLATTRAIGRRLVGRVA